MSRRTKRARATGAPLWLVTYADMMTLVLTFFVLLLSFSELDLKKYKEIAGSVEKAFGVHREIEIKKIPAGTSIIAQEFAPGRPEPTPLREIRQHTTDSNQQALRVREVQTLQDVEMARRLEQGSLAVQAVLKNEIKAGLVDVEVMKGRAVIRVRENGSFPLGHAEIDSEFVPVLHRLSEVLAQTEGMIIVAGHTDDLPISTDRFRSNWDLSAARAASVAHELLRSGRLPPDRIIVEGYADTRSLGPNDTVESRARNRRVEITLVPGADRVPGRAPSLDGGGRRPCPGSAQDCKAGTSIQALRDSGTPAGGRGGGKAPRAVAGE